MFASSPLVLIGDRVAYPVSDMSKPSQSTVLCSVPYFPHLGLSPNVRPNVVAEWLTLLPRHRQVPGSNLSPGDRLCWLSFIVVFSSPSRRMPALYLKLGHDHFLPDPLPFIIIHLSPCHRHYILPPICVFLIMFLLAFPDYSPGKFC
jgi:hypothetical protein